MDSNPLEGVPTTDLRRLLEMIRNQDLSGWNHVSIRRTSPSLGDEVVSRLVNLAEQGWTATQLGQLIVASLDAHDQGLRESHLVDLVLSGPEHPGIPMRDTLAVFSELIESAEDEILIGSYAIYNGREILARLAERMTSVPTLRVSLFLDIQRDRNSNTLPEQCVAKYRHEFVTRQWPGSVLPSLYYFRPSLAADWREKSSMHAKVVVTDRRRIFISSANLTKAAQTKNIEIGTLIESPSLATRTAGYFRGLVEQSVFVPF